MYNKEGRDKVSTDGSGGKDAGEEVEETVDIDWPGLECCLFTWRLTLLGVGGGSGRIALQRLYWTNPPSRPRDPLPQAPHLISLPPPCSVQ